MRFDPLESALELWERFKQEQYGSLDLWVGIDFVLERDNDFSADLSASIFKWYGHIA